MSDVIHIIVNPVAGHGKAPEFVKEYVEPIYDRLKIPYKVYETTGVRDAGRIGRQILGEVTEPKTVTVVIVGGDGTAHELIEGVLEGGEEGPTSNIRWNLVILPLGTANALFYSLFPPQATPGKPETRAEETGSSTVPNTVRYHLSSLLASRNRKTKTKPRHLPIILTTITDATGNHIGDPIPSHIVLSTSLHANLIKDSEELRAEHPGLERFKIAAEKNLGVWHYADITLVPNNDGRVEQYHPARGSHPGYMGTPYTFIRDHKGDYTVPGPFAYVLSTTTATRLEPSFHIAPLLSRFPPAATGSMDLLIVRPTRDPTIRKTLDSGQGTEAALELWKSRIRQVMGYVYKDGKHVDLTFADIDSRDGMEVGGDGEVVVEYVRCKGFKWTPKKDLSSSARVVCADGSLHEIPEGGSFGAQVRTEPRSEDAGGFYVWV